MMTTTPLDPIDLEADPGALEEFDPTPVPAQVCSTDLGSVLYAGEACPDCGHTSTAHPGTLNPALAECILCRVSVSVAQLRQVVADVASLAFGHEGRISALEGTP